MENNEPIRNQEIEIDLVALFHELVKHWKALVASMVLLAAVFGLYSKITFVPEYEASAEMYVLTKSTSITSLADIQVGSSLTNDYEYVITGRTVLSQVIDNLDMDETYEQLSKRVSIENPTDTRVLKIVVTDTDLEASKQWQMRLQKFHHSISLTIWISHSQRLSRQHMLQRHR